MTNEKKIDELKMFLEIDYYNDILRKFSHLSSLMGYVTTASPKNNLRWWYGLVEYLNRCSDVKYKYDEFDQKIIVVQENDKA